MFFLVLTRGRLDKTPGFLKNTAKLIGVSGILSTLKHDKKWGKGHVKILAKFDVKFLANLGGGNVLGKMAKISTQVFPRFCWESEIVGPEQL